MKVIYYKLLKVDNVANIVTAENFANEQNIHDYIWELVTNCTDSDGDREYSFEPLY